jgi:hypothetical protein
VSRPISDPRLDLSSTKRLAGRESLPETADRWGEQIMTETVFKGKRRIDANASSAEVQTTFDRLLREYFLGRDRDGRPHEITAKVLSPADRARPYRSCAAAAKSIFHCSGERTEPLLVGEITASVTYDVLGAGWSLMVADASRACQNACDLDANPVAKNLPYLP